MPRRSILSVAERTSLLLPPDTEDELIRHPKGEASYDALMPMISNDKLKFKAIRAHWDEILRPATSIKQGTVTASLMLRKLSSYPRQNGLAVALTCNSELIDFLHGDSEWALH